MIDVLNGRAIVPDFYDSDSKEHEFSALRKKIALALYDRLKQGECAVLVKETTLSFPPLPGERYGHSALAIEVELREVKRVETGKPGMKLFVVCVYGLYGGEWYCAVYAETDEQALQKARERYPITDENYRDYEQGGCNLDSDFAEAELAFANGVSNLWWVGW
jgi:hypothetical protein